MGTIGAGRAVTAITQGLVNMERAKVFISLAVPEVGIDMLREVADVKVWEGGGRTSRPDLIRELADCEGLLCVGAAVDAEVLEAAPKLKVISTFGVGHDHIDIGAATARGVLVGYTPHAVTEATADLTWALIMGIARRLVEASDYVRGTDREGGGTMFMLGQDVFGATLGVIGFGRIGQAVARRARGFEMRILYYDVRRDAAAEAQIGAQYAELDDLLRQSQFVSIHCAFTPETYHLIGARELSLMGRDSFLINASRGLVVDQAALYAALKSGQICGAGLDVTEVEPIPPEDPLLTLKNVIVLPHIGSASHAARAEMSRVCAENIIAGLRGLPLPYCVNPEVQGGR